MKILLDNCITEHARSLFPGHTVSHAQDFGWQNLPDHILIPTGGQAGFDVLVTVDKSIRTQHNLKKMPLSVIELDVVQNNIIEISKHKDSLPSALELSKQHRFVSIKMDGALECLAGRGMASEKVPSQEKTLIRTPSPAPSKSRDRDFDR